MTKTARDLRSAAHALEEVVTALRALSDDLNESDPAWPTAPLVWWDGKVWVSGDNGVYQTAGDYWAKSHLDSLVQPVRDGARRFAREAVPVAIVPAAEWVILRRCVEYGGAVWDAAEALVDATERLGQADE